MLTDVSPIILNTLLLPLLQSTYHFAFKNTYDLSCYYMHNIVTVFHDLWSQISVITIVMGDIGIFLLIYDIVMNNYHDYCNL